MAPAAEVEEAIPAAAAHGDFSKMGIYVDGRTKNELAELLASRSMTIEDVTPRDVYNLSAMHYLDDEPMAGGH
jgi:hypothetical protein